MSELVAIVTISHEGSRSGERELEVRSLDELFSACRNAPPSRLVRVSLRGPEGEVRLNFASFMRG